jgi:hypothetical protein
LPITAISAISPVPREPATPADVCRGAVAPMHGGWLDNRSQPDARRERTPTRVEAISLHHDAIDIDHDLSSGGSRESEGIRR